MSTLPGRLLAGQNICQTHMSESALSAHGGPTQKCARAPQWEAYYPLMTSRLRFWVSSLVACSAMRQDDHKHRPNTCNGCQATRLGQHPGRPAQRCARAAQCPARDAQRHARSCALPQWRSGLLLVPRPALDATAEPAVGEGPPSAPRDTDCRSGRMSKGDKRILGGCHEPDQGAAVPAGRGQASGNVKSSGTGWNPALNR